LDNGIRNAIISQFNDISLRNDVGSLWEIFLFMERLKRNSYTKQYINSYFWRTYSHKEIDLIEEKDGNLNAYEVKWSIKKDFKAPKEWKETYPSSNFLKLIEIIIWNLYLISISNLIYLSNILQQKFNSVIIYKKITRRIL
jgi:hypothetical protein